MCGIAGIISLNPASVSAVLINKMTGTLAHRGPDGEGYWKNSSGHTILGHRRLAIIDLSDAGNQPLSYLGRYSIIHNGEIYNYIELKEELRKKGYSFSTQTDTEVIAAAYDCWGDECIEWFDGMFAFAIWDEKENKLFAARDRFGEKPFFFYHDKEQFVFASEMKALWSAGIERKVNLKMLFNYLTIGYTDNPNIPEETFFESVCKLPASSFLTISIDDFNPVITSYWDIDPEFQDEKITDEEAEEKFNFLFQLSVSRRLRSDVTVGTSLSGGLDSSSVVSIASSLSAKDSPMMAFTAGFPGFEKDETSYAKLVAEKFQLKHFITEPGAYSLIADFEKLCYHQEEPFGSASVFSQYKVYELAKQHGIKVLLDGQGADETLAGYHKYYKWHWQELFQKRKLLKSGELKAAKEKNVNEHFGLRNIIAALFPDFATVVLEKQYLLNALNHPDLTNEFVKQQSQEAYYTTPAHHNLNGVLYFNTMEHGLEELLRYADRNAMAHGREVRLPFLNHELVEFVFSLPPAFKIRNGWTKWLLRKSMENSLPAEITWRTDKTGFEPPQKSWMKEPALKEMINESKRKLVTEKILRPGVLDKKIQPHDAYAAESSDWRYLLSGRLL